MNYLAHLHLGQIASNDPLLMVGNMMGDFVKGPIPRHYSPVLRQAIGHHRSIDAYTDAHTLVANSRALFQKPFRRYAGVLVDLCFDHLLCKHWRIYSDRPLGEFIELSYRLLSKHNHCFPEPLKKNMPRMIAADFLNAYHSLDGLEKVMQRISGRMKRPFALDGAMPQLKEHYALVELHFHSFYPQLMEFARQALKNGANSFSDSARKRVE